MSSVLTPRHVVPADQPGSHVASERCACGPVVTFRDLGTGAPVYRHRAPFTTRTVECDEYRDHTSAHRFLTGQGWVCSRCHPERMP